MIYRIRRVVITTKKADDAVKDTSIPAQSLQAENDDLDHYWSNFRVPEPAPRHMDDFLPILLPNFAPGFESDSAALALEGK